MLQNLSSAAVVIGTLRVKSSLRLFHKIHCVAVSVEKASTSSLLTRAVEIPCPTCPTWSHFIQDKLEISSYLSWDKYKCIKLIHFCIFIL